MIGKHSHRMDAQEFEQLRARYADIHVDLGTGDGRFVLDAARRSDGLLAIGVDACRENLVAAARAVRPGKHASQTARSSAALFIIAGAERLPAELYGQAARVTINFPWGSLRDGLLQGDAALLAGLQAIMRPDAQLELRLNASALAEAGWELLPGGDCVCARLAQANFITAAPRLLDSAALRALPSTWARRLAYGRKPEALLLSARACP